MLRFLEGKGFRRVAGTREIAVDVRVIAATHRDIEAEVKEKYVYARSWAFFEYFRNGFGARGGEVDLARVSEALRLRLARGEVFNVGGTEEISIHDLARLVIETLRSTSAVAGLGVSATHMSATAAT